MHADEYTPHLRSDVPVYDSARISLLVWSQKERTDRALLDMLELDELFPMAVYWTPKPELRRYLKRLDVIDPEEIAEQAEYLNLLNERPAERVLRLLYNSPSMNAAQVIELHFRNPRKTPPEINIRGGAVVEILLSLKHTKETEEAFFTAFQPKLHSMGLQLIDKQYEEARWHIDLFGVQEMFEKYEFKHPWALPLLLQEFFVLDEEAAEVVTLGELGMKGEAVHPAGFRSKSIDPSGSSFGIVFKYQIPRAPENEADRESLDERSSDSSDGASYYQAPVEVFLEMKQVYSVRYFVDEASGTEDLIPVGTYYLRAAFPTMPEEEIAYARSQFVNLLNRFASPAENIELVASIDDLDENFTFEEDGSKVFVIPKPVEQEIPNMQAICPTLFPGNYTSACSNKRYPSIIFTEEEYNRIRPPMESTKKIECPVTNNVKGERRLVEQGPQQMWLYCKSQEHPHPTLGRSKKIKTEYYCCSGVRMGEDDEGAAKARRARDSLGRKKVNPLPNREEQLISDKIRDILLSLKWVPDKGGRNAQKIAKEKRAQITFHHLGSDSKLGVLESLARASDISKKGEKPSSQATAAELEKKLSKIAEEARRSVNLSLFRQELFDASDAQIVDAIDRSVAGQTIDPRIWVRMLEEHYRVNIFLFEMFEGKKLEPLLPRHIGPYYKELRHKKSVMLLYYEESGVTELIYHKVDERIYSMQESLNTPLLKMLYFVQGTALPPPRYELQKTDVQIVDTYGKARGFLRMVGGQRLLFVLKHPQVPTAISSLSLAFETPDFDLVAREDLTTAGRVVADYENFVEMDAFYVAVKRDETHSLPQDPIEALICGQKDNVVKLKIRQKRGTNVLLHYVMFLFIHTNTTASEFAERYIVVTKKAQYDFEKALAMPEAFPNGSMSELAAWIQEQQLGLVEVSSDGNVRIVVRSEAMRAHLVYFLETLGRRNNLRQISPFIDGYYRHADGFNAFGGAVEVSVGAQNPLQKARYATSMPNSEMREAYFVVYSGYLYLVQNVFNREKAAITLIDNWIHDGQNSGYHTIVRNTHLDVEHLSFEEINQQMAAPQGTTPKPYYILSYSTSRSAAMIRLNEVHWYAQ